MSFTTSDYLNQLETDRQDLVDNLETQGITGLTGDETFTALVPEVLNISGGSSNYNATIDISKIASADIGSWGLCTIISEIGLIDTSALTSMQGFFKNCQSLTTIPLLDTSSSTRFTAMFDGCISLTTVPLFDTSKGVQLDNMFKSCTYLTTIPLFDFSSATETNSMFYGCFKLTSVPQLNTGKVNNMRFMFYDCRELETVPILDTSKVTNYNLQNMFYNCYSLTDASLNNILQMCINATTYTGTKTLKYLGFSETNYPVSRIEGLAKYSDFTSAGWTIGY